MIKRVRISIQGAVQGVGFRPFIFCLAEGLGLKGWVLNSSDGVFIEAEGNKDLLDTFLLRIEKEKPPHSFIQSFESTFLDPAGYADFVIRHSEESGPKTALVLPDIATCAECRVEIFDPSNRRYRYPFTNCTHCGPRYTIIGKLPYDRAQTTMKDFIMCPECLEEYQDPKDRRFHAQPNACPVCGPHLEFWNPRGVLLASRDEALLAGAEDIRLGKAVAVKGMGGFHIVVDARNESAVVRLRKRKHRLEKPLALMYPDLRTIREDCDLHPFEERLLQSSEAPIVLAAKKTALKKRSTKKEPAPSVSPGNPRLGVMLPYTPLHHLLTAELGFPLVATSGNISDEPICINEKEALERLGGMVDSFLVHNRPILRPVDDSVVSVVAGRELVIRRARGFAPLPVRLHKKPPVMIAVGGHLKNTVAVTSGRNVFISQHVGDLETKEAVGSFYSVISSLKDMYQVKPLQISCDLHPDYISTRYAMEQNLAVKKVQHHHAHVASCMAENELDGQVLGVSWDGTGYGPDGTIWGGEFLLSTPGSFRRVGTFRPFRLPGGGAAVREPRRSALGFLYEIFGPDLFNWNENKTVRSFSVEERRVIFQMVKKGLNTPWTTSAGRLFDGVASLMGLRHRSSFEGQAAMELEFLMEGNASSGFYSPKIRDREELSSGSLAPGPAYPLGESAPQFFFDWQPMILEILGDLKKGTSGSLISIKFHNTLVELIVEAARRSGEERVVLSGGCFQNRYLTEQAVGRLKSSGFKPYWHQRIPPNDGGLSLGQVYASAERGSPIKKEGQKKLTLQPYFPTAKAGAV